MPLWIGLLIAGLPVARTSLAWADSGNHADALIREALDLRRAGADSKARHLFREAYELSHSPRSAGQLGFCEQALGSWLDAEGHLEEALRRPEDPWIKKNSQTIQDALVLIKTHIARIEVTGEPPGAKVLLNGIAVGQLPMGDAVATASGEVEIELRAAGFAPSKRTLHAEGGQYYKVSLNAEKESPATPQATVAGPAIGRSGAAATATGMGMATVPAPVGGSPTGPTTAGTTLSLSATEIAPSGAANRGPVRANVEATSASGAFRRSLKFVSWGLAAAALGVGAYGFVHNDTQVHAFDAGCGFDSVTNVLVVAKNPPPGYTRDKCAEFKSSYEAATTLAVVGFVAGGVLAVGGLALWLTESDTSDMRTAGWSCVPSTFGTSFASGKSGPSVSCLVRF